MYGSQFNQPFPGSASINFRYLVAPFWDDADSRHQNSQVSYEIHQSGYFLDNVNEFLRRKRPSTFQGTWMMVAYWEAVRQYYYSSHPEVAYITTLLLPVLIA